MIPQFLLGMVAAQNVDVGGQLYLGELLGIMLVPLLVRRKHVSRTERQVVVFAILWAGAQALSDAYNHTAVGDSLKGVFAPLVFIAAILGLTEYFRAKPSRMPSLLLGVAIGTVISVVFFPTEYALLLPWKFGIGAALLSFFAIHFSFFLRRKSLVWLFIALCSFLAVSLYYDSRGMAVLPLLAGLAYALSRAGMGVRFLRCFGGKWGPIRLLPLIIAAVFLLNVGATAVFSSDYFLSKISPAAAQKYKTQASGTFGILLGGRSELLVSGQAFLDKPLLGHGSWPKDTDGRYRQTYARRFFELGYSQSYQQIQSSPWIPTHSYLMGALVWSGILGGLFWVVLVYLVLKRFLATLGQVPFYFYIGVGGFLWDVLFNPFAASTRWGTALFLAAFLAYTRAKEAMRRVVS